MLTPSGCRATGDRPGLGAEPPHPGAGQVEGHATNEGARRVVGAHLVPAAESGNERVVGQVLGRPTVASNGVDDGDHRGQISAVQRVEVDQQRIGLNSGHLSLQRKFPQAVQFSMSSTRTTSG